MHRDYYTPLHMVCKIDMWITFQKREARLNDPLKKKLFYAKTDTLAVSAVCFLAFKAGYNTICRLSAYRIYRTFRLFAVCLLLSPI